MTLLHIVSLGEGLHNCGETFECYTDRFQIPKPTSFWFVSSPNQASNLLSLFNRKSNLIFFYSFVSFFCVFLLLILINNVPVIIFYSSKLVLISATSFPLVKAICSYLHITKLFNQFSLLFIIFTEGFPMDSHVKLILHLTIVKINLKQLIMCM
uniref:Uncharacterized protein n=1 Tax=Anguilla anguilla TaxID=7936 RepID=A0A0E9X256_ANGAN